MRTMLIGVGVLLFIGATLASAVTRADRVLSSREIALVRGAQLNAFVCSTNLATCDEYNFGDSCGAGIPPGGICLNCTNEIDVHDNCVQMPDQTCTQFTGAKDCGDKVLGNCTGGVCSGNIMSLSETCALDLNDCS